MDELPARPDQVHVCGGPVPPSRQHSPREQRAGAPRPTALDVLAALASRRGYRSLFVALAALTTLGYTLLLPLGATKRVSFASWGHLTGQQLGLALALGTGLAAVLTLQVYAFRQATARRAAGGGTTLGGTGLLTSLASAVCCTPILPTVLAVFGVGALGASATMGFVTAHAGAFFAASLVVMVAAGYWMAHRIAAAQRAHAASCCPLTPNLCPNRVHGAMPFAAHRSGAPGAHRRGPVGPANCAISPHPEPSPGSRGPASVPRRVAIRPAAAWPGFRSSWWQEDADDRLGDHADQLARPGPITAGRVAGPVPGGHRRRPR